VFGLPFLIVGIFTTLIGFGILPVQNSSSELRRLMLLWMGLPFLAAGGVLVFGRRSTIFDVGQRRVTRSWSLVMPLRREERSLDEFAAVLLAFESESDSADSYPVRLKARFGKDLAVYSSTKFEESRERAEFLARFFRLDLEDRSTDRALVVSPDHVGETLQQRLRSGQLQPERLVRPMSMRTQVDESAVALRLVIPGRRAAAPFVAAAAIPILLALFLVPPLMRLHRRTDTPDTVQAILLASLVFVFGVFPLLGMIFAVLTSMRSKTVVTASPAEMVIERLGAWRAQKTRIAAEDILALDYSSVDDKLASLRRPGGESAVDVNAMEKAQAISAFASSDRGSRLLGLLKKLVPSKGIIVKSRHGLFAFGERLSGEELQYLQSLITRALAG